MLDMSYGYDAAGRRQTLTYPGGQVLTHGYDLAGRLTSLLDGARTISLAYDAVGRRVSLAHANGTQTTYAYDLASRLTGLTHATSGGTPLEAFTYGYDAADSRTSLTTLAQSVGYGYDLANRLTGVTTTPGSPIPPEAFTYDRVGNRLTGPTPTNAYTYNAGHQLLSAPGATYTYDLTGNRATKTDAAGTTTYTWDAANRLVQAVVPTAGGPRTVSYAYDALGRRVRKVVVEPGGATTRTLDYVYDGEDILLAIETTDTGGTLTTVTTRYVHGPGIDEPLVVEDGGPVYAVHADALGSIAALSDGSQTLAEASTYTSYGRLTRSDGVAGTVYAYTGREWEPELGLYYYRARYYDPEAGRFLSRDPIGFAGGDSNLYAYVYGDPTNLVDPPGLWGISLTFYAGAGANFIIGRQNGKTVLRTQLGVGVGAGASFVFGDVLPVPVVAEGTCKQWWWAGASASVEATVGPVSGDYTWQEGMLLYEDASGRVRPGGYLAQRGFGHGFPFLPDAEQEKDRRRTYFRFGYEGSAAFNIVDAGAAW